MEWHDIGQSDSDDLDASRSSDDGNNSDDSDTDDEAALQAELAKLRAEAQRIQEEKGAKEDDSKLEEAALIGNPLMAEEGATGKLKRKWNDEVVFRN